MKLFRVPIYASALVLTSLWGCDDRPKPAAGREPPKSKPTATATVRRTTVPIEKSVATASAPTTATPTEEPTVRPKVVRIQTDGGKFYQRIDLGQANFKFFERPRQIKGWSRLLDFSFFLNDANALSRFQMILRAEGEKYSPAPIGGQAVGVPASRWTVYNDLDGDTVLDTMLKVGPGLHETYILHENAWIRVGSSKAKMLRTHSLPDRIPYSFKDGKWQKER